MNISQELKARFLQRLHEKYHEFGYHGSEEEIGRDIACYFSDFAELLNLLERYYKAKPPIRKKSIRDRIMPFMQTGWADDGKGKPFPLSPLVTHFSKHVYDEKGNVKGWHILPSWRTEALDRFLDAAVDASIEAIEDVREAEKLESVAAAPESGSVQHKKINPQHYGGKELCIVVSWQKSGKRDARKLAQVLKNKAGIKYERGAHPDPARWYKKDPGGFINHCYKLRRKAKDKEWYECIPRDFWKSYE